MAEPTLNESFVALLMQLHYTAWVQLGKVANPATGKVERDLEAAKGTIDMLGALDEKSKGNLQADEEKLLTRMLLELRMNYVEEAKEGETPASAAADRASMSDTPSSADQAGGAGPAESPPAPEAPPSPSEGTERK